MPEILGSRIIWIWRQLPFVLFFVFMCALAKAEDPALLIDNAQDGQVYLSLSLEDLRGMDQVTLRTSNEYSDGVVAYRGPLMRDVLALAAIPRGSMLNFMAVNDYQVGIPASDFWQYDAILALEADGVPLSRRQKGPIWLMYPMSLHSELQKSAIYNSRLIWQLIRISVL